MARPSLTFPRFCLVVAVLLLGAWWIQKLYDGAPGLGGVRSGKVPGDAVYAGGANAKAPWGDVWVQVRRQDPDAGIFQFDLYSGSTGERLSQFEMKADGAMPMVLDPRKLVLTSPATMAYPASRGALIPLHLTAGTWPFADPK